ATGFANGFAVVAATDFDCGGSGFGTRFVVGAVATGCRTLGRLGPERSTSAIESRKRCNR
ncbi:MAG: hypothetical protein CMQ61_05235, partial [Gammaproteobacteria bacterium]|nr:hypothetical protein [Gammaproteobacteria bacterium]